MPFIVLILLAHVLIGRDAAAAPKTPTAAPEAAARSAAAPAGEEAAESADRLEDSAVLARIEGKPITVRMFREGYFMLNPPDRPDPDSAGRVGYLNTLIDKEVLELTTREIDRPLPFEDRLTMRQHTRTVIDNVFYQRMVTDSVVVTKEEIRRWIPQFAYDQRLRSIPIVDHATAERVCNDIIRGRISWTDAVRLHAKYPLANPEGDLGWIRRAEVSGEYGLYSFELSPGGPPRVLPSIEGYQIVQCTDRRPNPARSPSFEITVINRDLKDLKRRPVVERFYDRVRTFAGVAYDTTNIEWAARHFRRVYEEKKRRPQNVLSTGGILPTIPPTDTGRVVVRIGERSMSLGSFLREYATIPALVRGDIVDVETFVHILDGPALTDDRVRMAIASGIEKDSLTIALIEKKRSELLVGHLFQDSVVNRVVVTPEMRRAYYEQRRREFLSVPSVRYARFVRMSAGDADALLERLRGGESAAAIMREDSLRGDDSTGTMEELRANQQEEFSKVLFEELRPGQSTRLGPFAEGRFLVLQLLHFEPEREMAYDEVAMIVDESVQNLEAERLLKELIARRRARYAIESHPDQVMRIPLTDPWMEKYDLRPQ